MDYDLRVKEVDDPKAPVSIITHDHTHIHMYTVYSVVTIIISLIIIIIIISLIVLRSHLRQELLKLGRKIQMGKL